MSYTLESFEKKVNELSIHPIKILEFSKVKEPCKYQCVSCGAIYDIKPAECLIRKGRKQWCKNCDKNHGYSLESFQKAIDNILPNSIKITDFTKVEEPCKYVCLECGAELSVLKAANLLNNKQRKFFCNKCHNGKEGITKEGYEKLLKSCDDNNITLVRFTNMTTPFHYKCKTCGFEGSSDPYRFLHRQNKCISCGLVLPNYSVYKKQFDESHADDFYEILNPQDYKNKHSNLLIRHSCGFIWKTSPYNSLYHNCPKCYRKQSKGEQKIAKFLDAHQISYIREYPVEIENHMLRFDFYLPDLDKYIEYQGEQHFVSVKLWGGEEGLEKRQKYDLLKKEAVGEKLIEISYLQFAEIDQILGSTTIPEGSREEVLSK